MLQVKTQVLDNTLIFQILEQDEKDRGYRAAAGKKYFFMASNGLRIMSRKFPDVV